MKRVILSFILVLSLTAPAIANDPKDNQKTQGVSSIVTGVTTAAASIPYLVECAVACVPCCLLGAAAGASSVASLAAGIQNFSAADDLESDGTLPNQFNSEGLLNQGSSFSERSIPLNRIKDAALQKMEQVNSMIDNIKSQGLVTDEMLANPEKFLTPEELAKFNAEKEKMMAEISDENSDSQEALQALLDNADAEGSQAENFQTASLAGASDGFSLASLNLESLLSPKDQGIQNSAPGYYGNVSLKSLRPESKLSLFERVSLKLKQEMKKS